MKKFFLFLTALLAGACVHAPEEWVEWEGAPGLDPATAFVPFVQEAHDVSPQLLDQMLLPGGETVEEAQTKASTFDISRFTHEIFSCIHAGQVKSYCGSYPSTDLDGHPVRLSGRVVLPANGKVSRIAIVCHYTITDDIAAPSRRLPIEGILAARGIAVIDPDYLGYGITSSAMHPYMLRDQTNKNVIDMYYSVLPFLEAVGAKPANADVFVLGYSQGGAVAVSVAQELEKNHPGVPVRRILAGGGPYDLCLTYDTMVEEDECQIPAAAPLMLRSVKVGHHLDNVDLDKLFQPGMKDKLFGWIDSKLYSTGQIAAMIHPRKLSVVLSAAAMDNKSPEMRDMYQALGEESVLYPGTFTVPKAPLYVFHTLDDKVVPLANTEAFLKALGNKADVTVDRDHYGPHGTAMLSFLAGSLHLMDKNGELR